MDSALAKQLSSEFEASFSKIMPELVQTLRNYEISKPLEVTLGADFFDTAMAARNCCFIAGKFRCPCSASAAEAKQSTLELAEEKAEQLCRDIEAMLRTALPQLSPVVKQAKENFEAQIMIDPVSEKGQISCQIVNDVLVCS
jgi:hypothetical protein